MRILIYEENLMWSARLQRSLAALGHEPVLRTKMPVEAEEADLAVVNLASRAISAEELVPKLRGWGIFVIAHAGHKEKELRELGARLECDRLATNSELTHRLAALLDEAEKRTSTGLTKG